MKITKYVAAAGAVVIAGSISLGAGLWQTLPIIGGVAYCASGNVSGNSQAGITGQGAANPAANTTTGTVICQTTVPAGPSALTGTEVIPVDLYTPGTQITAGGPSTAVLPATALGFGYGTDQVWTTTGTGQNPVIANGVANFVYAGSSTATFATLTLPVNPIDNQRFCIFNSTTHVLTLTAIQVAATAVATIDGGATASATLAATTNNSAAAALSDTCYLYVASVTKWYKIL